MDGDAHPSIGHNRVVVVEGQTSDDLRTYLQRIERLDEERKQLGSDIKDVLAEAKSRGFDVAVLRVLLRLRKQDPDRLAEHEALVAVYRNALGM